MKFTQEERLDTGRCMYNKEISYRDAMELYSISETCAHKCCKAAGIKSISKHYRYKKPEDPFKVYRLKLWIF